ncbi:MAG: hypothetical protein KDI38_17920 [Calditrichaeota bacterium]|nr:hypothetical protein [Calditrichota bacterium]MCB0316221.1 hypothetical protein [Calditrichota bacterium]
MKYFQKLRMTFLLGILLCMAGTMSAQEEKGVFIVNESVPVESISKKDLEKIYLGKMKAWEGKLKISPCLMDEKTELGERFFDDVLDMSYRKFSGIWRKIVFSGSSPAPAEFKTSEEVIEYVSQHDGGMGFIPESMLEGLEGCKVLKIEGLESF